MKDSLDCQFEVALVRKPLASEGDRPQGVFVANIDD